jgi:hypothetical protein
MQIAIGMFQGQKRLLADSQSGIEMNVRLLFLTRFERKGVSDLRRSGVIGA